MSNTQMERDQVKGRDAFGRQGFGSMRLRDDTADTTDRDPVAVINAAFDMGVTMVDTADAYQNEELVGRAIRGRREKVLLASKFGLVWADDAVGGFEVRADSKYVREACEASPRLGTDMLDLYYLSVDDLGVVVVAHSPTSHGLLHQSISNMMDRPVSSTVGSALHEIAASHDATAGQIALAWVHHRQQIHGVPVVPIPGTTSVSHLRTNVGAADIRLSMAELRKLDSPQAAS